MTTKTVILPFVSRAANKKLLFYKGVILEAGLLLCLLFSFNADANTEFSVRDVSAVEAAELLKNDANIRVLDVRTGFEFNRGHIKGAVNLNYYSRKFTAKLDTLDKNVTWLVHCRTGVRSGKTLPFMKAAGFVNVIHLQDGIVDWTKSGLPTVK